MTIPISRERVKALKESQATPRPEKAPEPAPVQARLPKTVAVLAELIRGAAAAGELAGMVSVFRKFVEKSTSTGKYRESALWSSEEVRTLELLQLGIELAESFPSETPIDGIFWTTLEDSQKIA